MQYFRLVTVFSLNIQHYMSPQQLYIDTRGRPLDGYKYAADSGKKTLVLTLKGTGSWSPKFRSCSWALAVAMAWVKVVQTQVTQSQWAIRNDDRWANQRAVLTVYIFITVCNRNPHTFTTQLTNTEHVGGSHPVTVQLISEHWNRSAQYIRAVQCVQEKCTL